jgi:hypothetical protein
MYSVYGDYIKNNNIIEKLTQTSKETTSPPMDTFDYPTLSTKINTNNPTLNKLATIIDINNGVVNFKHPVNFSQNVNFNSSTNLTLPTPTTMSPTTNPTMNYMNTTNPTMNYMNTTNPTMDYNTNYMNTTNPTMDSTTMTPTTNVNLLNEINNNVLNGLFNY